MKICKKLKVFIFIGGLVLTWMFCSKVLQTPKNEEWQAEGLKKVYEKPNYYDVIISGTSIAITNISAEELYLAYGIASVSIGEPEQMTFLSYYALENALKYQSPKVVLFDIQSIFYSEDVQKERIITNENYYVHYTLDDIEDVKIKSEAVEQVKKINSESTYWDYFSKMFYNHANWENINKRNFISKQKESWILNNRNLIGVQENVSNIRMMSAEDNTKQKVEIPEVNIVYLKKIADLCKSNNIKLVLTRGCGSQSWDWEQYNTAVDLAQELEVPYLDLTMYEEEIGFDWTTDSYDGRHHNVNGTKKWTDFIGNYLVKNYNLEDRRDNEKYSQYEKEKEKYTGFVSAMQTKIDLLRAVNLNQYFDTLLNMDKTNNTIFISVYDEASNCLSDISQNYIWALGLDTDLRDKYRYSYYGLIDDGIVADELCSENGIQTSGILGNGEAYDIISGGWISEQESSIKINGTEYGQGGRGINIVVYNKISKEVLSSVYFDTFAKSNPEARRIVNGISQCEIDINTWENVNNE